ncbi:MAG: succinylglutamate desuccinylase/aspartoacylase family protein [Candidatus Kaiserbacteria bacterium]|nr:succinylglutamate desuccinylase/aspartoacylase family protein [Candidatus Kaiserbacteria bacterium]
MTVTQEELLSMFSKHRGRIPYVFSFGRGNGPHSIIVGALHGNEDAGLQAIHALHKERDSIIGTVTAVLGNPEAYKKDVRYSDENLNRIFRNPIQGSTYESKRARELSALFTHIAKQNNRITVIDIHTTSQGEEPLFMCHRDDRQTLQFLKKTPLFESIVLITEALPYSLCALTRKCNFSYIGAECGKHKTEQANNNARMLLEEVLVRLKIKAGRSMHSRATEKKVVKIEQMIVPTPGLQFVVQEVKTVTSVKKGEVWAVDDAGKRIAEKDMALFCVPKKVRHTDTNAGFICAYGT